MGAHLESLKVDVMVALTAWMLERQLVGTKAACLGVSMVAQRVYESATIKAGHLAAMKAATKVP